MKTLIFKRYGVVKIYMLFKCTTKDNCKKDIDFILPLYFSIDHIKKIELAWKKYNKNNLELISLNSMNELSAILPKVELMYLNDYVKYHFSVSQIEIFVKDIEFDMYDWKLSSNDRN